MAFVKPTATLSAGLLARKGMAMPTSSILAFAGAVGRGVGEVDAAARAATQRKVSLRLDAERHRRLRLAAVRAGRSGQQLLLEALDEYLAGVVAAGSCPCLAAGDS